MKLRSLLLILAILFSSHAGLAAPGDADPGFSPGADDLVRAVMPLPDGRVVAAGRFAQLAATARDGLGILLENGSIDPDFAPPSINGSGRVLSVVPLRDGRVVVGGEFLQVNGESHSYLARFEANGDYDDTFKPQILGRVISVLEQPDGKLLVAGAFVTINEQARFHIARFEEDGSLDPTFVPSGIDDEIQTMALLPDGSILIGGIFQKIDGIDQAHLAKLGPTGVFDSTYTPTVSLGVNAIALQADGKALIGGGFTEVNGQPRRGLARLFPNGNLDPSLNQMILPTAVVAVTVQADGGILFAGQFTTVNGIARVGMARLVEDGGLDADLDPASNGFVDGISLDVEGRILVAGSFNHIGGADRDRLARLENDPVTESLAPTSRRRVEWLRGGSAPEATWVSFELSTDGGTSFTPLGTGGRIPGGWALAGLRLPLEGTIRARASTRGGFLNNSSGLVESVAPYTLPAPKPPSVRIRGKRTITTTRPRITLRGNASDPDGDLVAVRFRDTRPRGRRLRPVRGLAAWSAVAVLKKGRNVFHVQAIDAEGLRSPLQRVTIRRTAKPKRR